MLNIDGLDLNYIIRGNSLESFELCKEFLIEIVKHSEKYDVIIDNGKVILSEKS
jgi:hypothetical protein